MPVLLSDSKYLRIVQTIVYSALILYFGRDLFIPLSFALLISFVLYPICAWMQRKGIGKMSAIIITVTILCILLSGLLVLLIQQFVSFVHEWPSLQAKLSGALTAVSNYVINAFGISKEQQTQWMKQIADQSAGGVWMFLSGMISVSTLSAVLMILIPVYAVLILYYRGLWIKVVYRLFPSERKENIIEILSLTIQAYYNFIKGMALVYLIVGTLNSIGLLLLGVPHAILFGFIASVLTFIPYIGIIIGSLLPITMAWITYDSAWYPLGIIAIFTFVQYLEANVIFPFAVSNRLNVNTLVMLIAIFAGGILWGMAGMILFVPFVGILKLIADHHPKWKTLSMALGMETNKME